MKLDLKCTKYYVLVKNIYMTIPLYNIIIIFSQLVCYVILEKYMRVRDYYDACCIDEESKL